MAHLSWYRKYRPQTFSDVVGQPHIEQTLRNAVTEGTVAHAYLFTGPRGTGKTTTARILAKALECDAGPTPDPDLTCGQCVAIAEGSHPDVLELDAASRRGIDEVREQIIGRVIYAPSRGAWKVYIIDEVHMLTAQAFNALLKTFEEPPRNTLFVLCTTDAHKVPETIRSRCQRFDFRRLSVDDLVGRLRYIADAENVTVSDGALALIARHALGGMRDAITNLEQLASFGGGTIELSDAEGLLGEVDAELLYRAADLVLERDVAGAFRLVAELAEAGIDMAEFVRGFVRHFRDLFVLAAVGADSVVDVTVAERGRLDAQAGRFGTDRLARVLEVLGRLGNELRYAADQRLAVEVALTRLARPQADLTLEAVAERVAALESGLPIRDVAAAATATPAPRETPSRGSTEPAAPVAGPAPQAGRPAALAALDVASVKRSWPAVVAEFRKLKPSRSYLFDGTEVEVSGEAVVVEFPSGQEIAKDLAAETETIAVLRRALVTVMGVEPPIEYVLGRGGASSGASRPERTEAPLERETDPAEAATVSTDELEASIIAELGAEVVADVTPGSDTD